jgi:hypothetical protein
VSPRAPSRLEMALIEYFHPAKFGGRSPPFGGVGSPQTKIFNRDFLANGCRYRDETWPVGTCRWPPTSICRISTVALGVRGLGGGGGKRVTNFRSKILEIVEFNFFYFLICCGVHQCLRFERKKSGVTRAVFEIKRVEKFGYPIFLFPIYGMELIQTHSVSSAHGVPSLEKFRKTPEGRLLRKRGPNVKVPLM